MNWNTIGKILILLSALCISALSNADPIWIDVRTVSEHNEDSIEGDILIPHEGIVEQVREMFPDKSTEIHLYCRTGGRAGRAGRAQDALEEAGYTNVSNAGGIEDARKERGLSQ